MQLRMDAGFRTYLDAHSRIINFAWYQAEVIVENNALAFLDNTITGLWDMERYITLLMGEIPRLRDDSEGYGPVSYTHLDVYKRQLKGRLCILKVLEPADKNHLGFHLHRLTFLQKLHPSHLRHINCLLYTSRCV